MVKNTLHLKCLTFFVIMEIKLKTTLTYHLTPIKKTCDSSCWWGCREVNTLPLLVELQNYIVTMKTYMVFPHREWNLSTSISSYSVTLGHIPKGFFIFIRDTCSTIFIAALFIIVKKRKQSICSSAEEYIMKKSDTFRQWYCQLLKNWTTKFMGIWISERDNPNPKRQVRYVFHYCRY